MLATRYQPYPDYCDSGVDWLGELPAHWEVKRLKFITREPLAYGANEAAEYDEPDWPRFIRITDIRDDGRLREDTFRSLPMRVAAPYLLEHGDLLFARSGATVGKSFMYRQEWGQACHAGYLIRVRLNDSVADPEFISYFGTSKSYWNWILSNFIQATIQNVSAEKYANLSIPVPPLSEQHTIVDFLDRETTRIDTLIEAKHRLIALLEEKRAALISHVVTKGLDPDVEMKDSGIEWLGEIPAHWGVKRLKFLISFVTSGSRGWAQYYSDDGALFIRIGNLSQAGVDVSFEDVQYVDPPTGSEGDRTRIEPGDLLISITANVGAVGVIMQDIGESYVNQHVALTRPLPDKANARWLAYCLHSDIGQQQFEVSLYGGTKDGLSLDDVKNLLVLDPPLAEQQHLVDYFDNISHHINQLLLRIDGAITRLEEYRTALIAAAVTGKIDVRGRFSED